MNKSASNLSRRRFLGQCCSAVGTTGILSTLAQLRVIGAVAGSNLDRVRAAALPPDYKALVCLFLNGGNDATNLIIPSDVTSYAAYAKSRADLALAQSSLLPITPRRYADGRAWGLHPAVPALRDLFVQGKLAVLANVGTLVRPTTLADYNAGKNLPPQLFSHSDQQLQWQSGVPDKPFETGWGGRLGDLLSALNSSNDISMCISIGGGQSFERGNTVSSYIVGSFGVPPMDFGPASPNHGTRIAALRNILAGAPPNLLEAAFGSISHDALNDSDTLRAALQSAPALKTTFPGNDLAGQLAMVARLISVAPTLGLKRQIFFVELAGWDLHAAQITGHGPLLAELSGAMKAFYDATVELGVANQVTTFTASDFGRTYIPNAGGTDHGWGNHQLIMGGAVQGGEFYGTMPSLAVGANDDTGRGRWIPSTSVDEYSATLARWFGVSDTNLPVVVPNLGRFAKPNLGFMG
ncbi:MAG: DUF1501 domain-containing protein [Verrucomicrobia bacterium]|nr:DUF1501 domain-containing protein [Verrucomicrobiota bacterium]